MASAVLKSELYAEVVSTSVGIAAALPDRREPCAIDLMPAQVDAVDLPAVREVSSGLPCVDRRTGCIARRGRPSAALASLRSDRDTLKVYALRERLQVAETDVRNIKAELPRTAVAGGTRREGSARRVGVCAWADAAQIADGSATFPLFDN